MKYNLSKSEIKEAGFEVITAVVMKSSTFHDITLSSSLKVSSCFGGRYLLYL
jgi:hypothetical protein